MTAAPDRAASQQSAAPDARDSGGPAWYLYGIIRAPQAHQEQTGGSQGETGLIPGSLRVEGIPLKLLQHGDLAAVVKPVSRQEFSDESLQERLRDARALEAMVRSHNQIIAAIHNQQAILPAKFGGVYARLEDVQLALEQAYEALRTRLDRLDGCDEWAVHIYADAGTVRQRAATESPSVRQLEKELAAARQGRAYFLQRKLDDQLAAAADELLRELAQTGYDQLARLAVAGQMSPPARPGANDEGAIELLRAAFLVARTAADAFIRGLDSFAAEHEGVRCEYSGPWPPYSFAAEEQP